MIPGEWVSRMWQLDPIYLRSKIRIWSRVCYSIRPCLSIFPMPQLDTNLAPSRLTRPLNCGVEWRWLIALFGWGGPADVLIACRLRYSIEQSNPSWHLTAVLVHFSHEMPDIGYDDMQQELSSKPIHLRKGIFDKGSIFETQLKIAYWLAIA